MMDINRPCVRNCCLNDEDVCLGCFRSFEDMRQWHKATDDEKTKILEIAQKTKELYEARRKAFSQRAKA